jgi:hypothetical protein
LLLSFFLDQEARIHLDKESLLGGSKNVSDEEKEQIVHEDDDQGNILAYPAWNKKNAPKDNQSKWEVPIYL